MKGLELSKAYFEEYGKPMLTKEFSRYKDQIAAGLVGEGSECFGFDDELSQDHDFGPGFCLWIPECLYSEIGKGLQEAYSRLPNTYKGYANDHLIFGAGRVGVFPIENFYRRYTNCSPMPMTNAEWFKIPERFLATATNGEVFCDPLGEFSKARQTLLAFYSEPVLRKKLAARAAVMAQSGQYNYGRSMKRGDYPAAYLACGEFIKAALSAIYLLNGAYMPFYKWAFRGAEQLAKLPRAVGQLRELVSLCDNSGNMDRKQRLIEEICIAVGKEFNAQGISQTTDAFLQNHCPEIMAGITDDSLRNLHVMADCD